MELEQVWKIKGITCGKCVRLITEGLQEFPGVSQVLVSKDLATAAVRYLPPLVSLGQMEASITSLVNGKFQCSSLAPSLASLTVQLPTTSLSQHQLTAQLRGNIGISSVRPVSQPSLKDLERKEGSLTGLQVQFDVHVLTEEQVRDIVRQRGEGHLQGQGDG